MRTFAQRMSSAWRNDPLQRETARRGICHWNAPGAGPALAMRSSPHEHTLEECFVAWSARHP